MAKSDASFVPLTRASVISAHAIFGRGHQPGNKQTSLSRGNKRVNRALAFSDLLDLLHDIPVVNKMQKPKEKDSTYRIRPDPEKRFRPQAVKTVLQTILTEELSGKAYDAAEASKWVVNIADLVKTKLKELGYDRYRFVVQVVIGEQRGEGVQMASNVMWDAESDNYASHTLVTDTLFCVVGAFGVYFY